MRKIRIVIDGQFGSTGKGLLAGYLAKQHPIDTIVTAWAANAGHTFIDDNGRKYVHTMLANGIVGPKVKQVLLGAGSIIDPENLQNEYLEAYDKMEHIILAIHPNAAIISQDHRDAESVSMTAIGSTKKGVGEAAIQRIKRDPKNLNTAFASEHPFIKKHVVGIDEYNQLLDSAKEILVEGAQGYSLSMYHGMYPYTTSRDVSTYQVLADCCIPSGFGYVEVYGCFRTFPIRVANRYDENGNQVGWSGPTYPDSREMDWSELGLEAELTTVTKLPRRIFTFSDMQFKMAIRQCGINRVFLNFVNYLPPEMQYEFIDHVNSLTAASVDYIGYGPTVSDVVAVPYQTDILDLANQLDDAE